MAAGQRSEDSYSNFTFAPPRSTARLRSFTSRSRYRMMSGLTPSSGAQLGSNSSLASSLSSSLSNLIDPARFMTMQDDAQSRRISSEVMKQCLYESVVQSPYRRLQQRRRMSACPSDYRNSASSGYGAMSSSTTGPAPDAGFYDVYGRMVQSLPVTPAASKTVTPSQSPTSMKRFKAFVASGSPAQWGMTPEDEEGEGGCRDGYRVREDSWKGLPSLFKPCPRYIPATELSWKDVTSCESLDMLPGNYVRGDCVITATGENLEQDDDEMEVEEEEEEGERRGSVIRLNTPPSRNKPHNNSHNNT